jgi:hypothetical protein
LYSRAEINRCSLQQLQELTQLKEQHGAGREQLWDPMAVDGQPLTQPGSTRSTDPMAVDGHKSKLTAPGSDAINLSSFLAALTDAANTSAPEPGPAAAAGAAECGYGSSSSSRDPQLLRLQLQLPQVLSGGVDVGSNVLRYKKKMLLWSDKEVGYCMMTFVIRNGLGALKVSEGSYMEYVAHLVRDAWKMEEGIVQKVNRVGG